MKKKILLWLITLCKFLFNAVYAVLKLQPLQKKVVMISRQSGKQRPDFQQIGNALRERDPSVKIVYLCREIGASLPEKLKYAFHLLHCAGHLATARVCIIDGYCIPVSVLKHRKELYVVQIWHALGAIKKFGKQSLDGDAGRDREVAERMNMHGNYDCVLSASRRTAEAFSEAFGVPAEKIQVIGVPRVDAILRMDRSRCRRRFYGAYPELRGKKNVLYVPTFRDNKMPDLGPVLRCAEELGVNLIVRLHPLDREKLKDQPGLPPLLTCDAFGTFTLMAAADAVITDYSAISIEASLIRKPVYFYVYDLEEYKATRGLNFDPLDEMPYCSSKEFRPLLEKILREPYDFDKLDAFRADFVETCDTENIARIVDLLAPHLTER